MDQPELSESWPNFPDSDLAIVQNKPQSGRLRSWREAGFAPVSLTRGDAGEEGEAEVVHGPGRRADVEGVEWRDEDDVEVGAVNS